MKINPKEISISRLVKSEDLNHHGTLFAGRTAEWFVESGFIAAASILNPDFLVCLKIHGMQFKKPVKSGGIIKLVSKVVHTGKTSLISHVNVLNDDETISLVSGFITFIYVDENTKSRQHNIELILENEKDKELNQTAKNLGK
ncbi:MAG: acyl-CoA thioesterase [Marinilabiliales bacterium]|nr:MAG: acyl-CoA thioesterase [Marinilabiliales bacterium]